jgi:hypothetical protein
MPLTDGDAEALHDANSEVESLSDAVVVGELEVDRDKMGLIDENGVEEEEAR